MADLFDKLSSHNEPTFAIAYRRLNTLQMYNSLAYCARALQILRTCRDIVIEDLDTAAFPVWAELQYREVRIRFARL